MVCIVIACKNLNNTKNKNTLEGNMTKPKTVVFE